MISEFGVGILRGPAAALLNGIRGATFIQSEGALAGLQISVESASIFVFKLKTFAVQSWTSMLINSSRNCMIH